MKILNKAISVHTLSIIMLLLAGLTAALSLIGEKEVTGSITGQTDILLEQREYISLIQELKDTSDYLAVQAAFFAVTQDTSYLFQYGEAVEKLGQYEKAYIAFTQKQLPEDAIALAEEIKGLAWGLAEAEARAMRLTADSIGMDVSEMPDQVAAVVYEKGEGAFSNKEKVREALFSLFGEEYQGKKQELWEKTQQIQNLVLKQKQIELDKAAAATQEAQRAVSLLNKSLLLLLACLAACFYFLVQRPFHQYAATISRLEEGSLHKLKPAGSKEAVLFADTFNKVYSEFTEAKKELENERFRFRMAIENTTVAVFEYDFASDTYSAYGNLEKTGREIMLPTERVIHQFMESYLANLIDVEFLPVVKKFLESKSFISADIRVKAYSSSNSYLWARITATPILGSHGEPVKLIGKIRNIEAEKEKEMALEDLKKRDSLTGLYTREAGIRLARDYMKQKTPDVICGIFILDMDDFEQVNREEGSAFADAILQETASILRSMTGPEDYQIRLGGDEFMLFIKNCPKSRATILGPQIVREIANLSGADDMACRISVSIGMCVTEVIDEYDGLYRCAESTLKFVKENRRGTAACYLDTSLELGERLIDRYPDRHEIDMIDQDSGKQGTLTSYALELLEKSKNLDDAVYLLLSRAGRSYGLGRVSIAEVDSGYLACRYLYQWASSPESRHRKDVYYITQEMLEALIHSYKNGLSEQPFIWGQKEYGSILHAAIWNHGSYEGFMSFEVKEEGYQWTEEQRVLIKDLSNVISSFVLRAKADSISRAKTEFLSRMSHEIRTPMNAITGMTEIALQMLDDREKVQNCLEKIKGSNAYLLNLINDILDMSRIESGKLELAPEAAFLENKLGELIEMMGPQFEQKGLKFNVVRHFDINQPIMADFLRLSQVLINLLGNALKFTMPGGEVGLAVEQQAHTGQRVVLKFIVKDTGIGIAKESLGRIFNAFEQADRATASAYGGTGLGLSISSKLIQLMGGCLEVQSELGQGSSFFFTLSFPAASTLEAMPALEGQCAPCHMTDKFAEGMRILLVEDNELNREIAETLLSLEGFTVENAVNGKEGVERFFSHPAHYYDAILMDIRMPIMDGLEAARQIRLLDKEDSRTIPIIAMTANAFDEDMRKSIESGMNGHLSKPLEIDKLMKALQDAIDIPGNHMARS